MALGIYVVIFSKDSSQRSRLTVGRHHPPLMAMLLLLDTAGCSSKVHPPPAHTESDGGLVVAPPEIRESILHWVGNEAVAVVGKPDSVVLVATESGRSKILRVGRAHGAVLDAEYDLLWMPSPTTIDVLDLRAPGEEAVPIAADLPECSAQLTIFRDLAGGTDSSLDELSPCETLETLTFEWTREPRWRRWAIDQNGESSEQVSKHLVGESWLREQFARATSSAYLKGRRRKLVPSAEGPGPVSMRRLNCGKQEPCGAAVPFGKSGQSLVLTDYWEGDCQHYGCRLYDPVTKKLSSLPDTSWADYGRAATLSEKGSPASAPVELRKIPPGPCGLYHFDRSGTSFLIGEKVCSVGGGCRDLGGVGMGWLSGGSDVGNSP